PVELDMLGLLGHHQVAVAAIDDAGRARHAGQANARGQLQVPAFSKCTSSSMDDLARRRGRR
ncbi:hypothetical protein, partial [Mesorhizobium sp. M8A.F.Ca.ET.207.01.1.1]|uniref:hypothetical protein n=1 Tax=Mesorhizobium sp. M8A.F.Ca.ET.207.01.1.1 TaxID=2563968 RepID=UPI001AEE19B0